MVFFSARTGNLERALAERDPGSKEKRENPDGCWFVVAGIDGGLVGSDVEFPENRKNPDVALKDGEGDGNGSRTSRVPTGLGDS